VIQKRELISLLPFTAKQKTKIKRYDPKMKKEIGQVQEKKRNCYHNILSLESLFMLISISIVRSATFFCKKTMIFRAVCLKLKVAQTIS
jgi:hypothetical protein